jgi:hypothetical protein
MYRRMKAVPNEQAQKAVHEALVRVFEHRAEVERRTLAEQRERLAPVYDELRAAVQKSNEMKGVLKAIESLGKVKPPAIEPLKKNLLTPKKPMFKIRGTDPPVIQVKDVPPFSPDTWYSQTGSNSIYDLTANGNTGDISFTISAGQYPPGTESGGEGQISCTAGVFVNISLPSAQCFAEFTAWPSFSWQYDEESRYWYQSKGTFWIGQSVSLWDQNGNYLGNPIGTQNTLASWDDKNLSGNGGNSGSTSSYYLYSSLQIGPEAEGGWMSYGCMIGASCNCNYLNGKAEIQFNANCNTLYADLHL